MCLLPPCPPPPLSDKCQSLLEENVGCERLRFCDGAGVPCSMYSLTWFNCASQRDRGKGEVLMLILPETFWTTLATLTSWGPGNRKTLALRTTHWKTKGRFRKRAVLSNVPSFRFSFQGNMWTYPGSGFRSGGTCERTLVPVFGTGEHPPKPPFCKQLRWWIVWDMLELEVCLAWYRYTHVYNIWKSLLCRMFGHGVDHASTT